MGERTLIIATLAVLVCLTQTIGFFSPAWFCKTEVLDTNTNSSILLKVISDTNHTSADRHDTCDYQGLFYPEGITDMDIFVLSITSMAGVWLCTGTLLCLAFCTYDPDESCAQNVCFVMIILFEIPAAIAGFMCMPRYDGMGWSSIMFMTVGMIIVLAKCAQLYEKYRNK